MQCAHHGILVEKLLQGHIDLEEWAKHTRGFSSILVEGGKELGEICMSDDAVNVKLPMWTPLYKDVQKRLEMAWSEAVDL
jgi:hypothetical protein